MTDVVVSSLRPEQRIAAFLDSKGEKREHIAGAVGVNVGTLSRWRAEEAYQTEVAKWASHDLELVTRIVERAKAEIAHAAVRSIETLVAALDAEKKNGEPLWGIRLEAAGMILNKVPLIAEEGNRGDARALAAVTLVVRRDDVGGLNVIDGTATEAL